MSPTRWLPPDPLGTDGVPVSLPADSRFRSLDFHRETTTYHGVPARSCESTSMAVVEGAATVLEQDPTTLTPLAAVVDPASVDRLSSQGVTMTFEYEGLRVTVYGDRVVEFVD